MKVEGDASDQKSVQGLRGEHKKCFEANKFKERRVKQRSIIPSSREQTKYAWRDFIIAQNWCIHQLAVQQSYAAASRSFEQCETLAARVSSTSVRWSDEFAILGHPPGRLRFSHLSSIAKSIRPAVDHLQLHFVHAIFPSLGNLHSHSPRRCRAEKWDVTLSSIWLLMVAKKARRTELIFSL